MNNKYKELPEELGELKKRFHVGGRGRKLQGNFGNHYHLCIGNMQLLMGSCTTPSNKWEAYQGIIPRNQHRTVEKNKRETNHVARFNNTLRKMISKLGREILFFSKKCSHYLTSIRLLFLASSLAYLNI